METELPPVMIMFDRTLAETRPDEAFYLRVDHGSQIEQITLSCQTLPGARRLAEDQGYTPTHWAQSPRWEPTRF